MDSNTVVTCFMIDEHKDDFLKRLRLHDNYDANGVNPDRCTQKRNVYFNY